MSETENMMMQPTTSLIERNNNDNNPVMSSKGNGSIKDIYHVSLLMSVTIIIMIKIAVLNPSPGLLGDTVVSSCHQ